MLEHEDINFLSIVPPPKSFYYSKNANPCYYKTKVRRKGRCTKSRTMAK